MPRRYTSFLSGPYWRALMAVLLFFMSLLGALPGFRSTPALAATAAPGNGGFNYGEALQKAILFYEAQRSGRLSTSGNPTRFTWRGDSQLQDGMDVGLDLTGGWVDAGDNVKFIFPMSQAVATLAWGAIQYRSALTGSGQLTSFLNQLRWANDWFIKAHPSANVFYGQVGNGSADHSFWGPIEVTNLTSLAGPTAAGQPTSRPSYSINTSCGGGADLAGGVAAAMAASSIVFRPTDPAYADTLLSHATQLDAFAHAYQQQYTTCIADAQGYYRSFSGFTDELVWSDIWMAKANDAKSAGSGGSFWTKARTEYITMINTLKVLGSNPPLPEYAWTFNWDAKQYGNYVLMALQYPNDPDGYTTHAERYLDYWMPGGGVAYTPGGHARLDQWGSFRYAANTALVAFIYADGISDAAKKTKYRNFGEQQINYILGQNPRNCSYLIGFGACSPQNPHHRTNHGTWLGYMPSPPGASRHILYGALVGSPTATDGFNDSVDDYVANEVAVDYNAGLVGALARMYSLYGGTPLAASAFPLPDKPHVCRDEYPVFVNGSSTANSVKLDVIMHNKSAWPARVAYSYKTRYYFTLDSASISDITVTGGGTGYTVTGPTLSSGNIYYVTINYTAPIHPGNNTWRTVNGIATITSSGTWNVANDPSWGGAGSTTPWDSTYTDVYVASNIYAANMPAYDGTTRLCGNEPGGSSNTPVPTTAVPPTRTNTPVTPTSVVITNTPVTPTRIATTAVPPTRTNTPVTPTRVGTTAIPTTRVPTTAVPPTRTNTPVTPTRVPTTAVPTTAVPTTAVPTTAVPTTAVPPTTGPSTLKVQYKAADTVTGDNQIKPHFNIVNTGTASVNMSELKIRYYFTKDAGGSMVFNCDWAVKGCGNLTSAFVAATGVNTDTYMEISFTTGAGAIAAGQSSGEMQIRLNKSDWTNFNETNDYSFDATKTAFTDHTKVVLLRSGTVVWGTAP